MHRAAVGFLFLAAAAVLYQQDAAAAVAPGDPADEGNGGTWLDSILGTVGLDDMRTPRGERNNNPGNIRLSSDTWQGQIPGSDTAFVTFATPEDGIRALAVLLKNYQRKYGLTTVRQIINRYAPPIENLTGSYVSAVARDMGVGPDEAINLNDAGTLSAMVNAIIHHENGRNVYAAATVAAGVSRA